MFPCRQWNTIPFEKTQTCLLSLNRLPNSVGFFFFPLLFFLFTFPGEITITLTPVWQKAGRQSCLLPSLLPIYILYTQNQGFQFYPGWIEDWNLIWCQLQNEGLHTMYRTVYSFDCSYYVLSGLSYLLIHLLQALFYYLFENVTDWREGEWTKA